VRVDNSAGGKIDGKGTRPAAVEAGEGGMKLGAERRGGSRRREGKSGRERTDDPEDEGRSH
jgi:hypothetical protein